MSHRPCTNPSCVGYKNALHDAHARLNEKAIALEKLQREMKEREAAIKFQTSYFKIEAENAEKWMAGSGDPLPRIKARGLIPREPVWPPPPQEFLDFLGREEVQAKLTRPKLDDYRGVELV